MKPYSRKQIEFFLSNYDSRCWHYTHNFDNCLVIMCSPETTRHEVNVMARRLIDTLAQNRQSRFLPREVLLQAAKHILSPRNPNAGKLTQRNVSRLVVLVATG